MSNYRSDIYNIHYMPATLVPYNHLIVEVIGCAADKRMTELFAKVT